MVTLILATNLLVINPSRTVIPFVDTSGNVMSNGTVQCSCDLRNWFDGEGIVWQRHVLDTNGAYEVWPINQQYNTKMFFRLTTTLTQ